MVCIRLRGVRTSFFNNFHYLKQHWICQDILLDPFRINENSHFLQCISPRGQEDINNTPLRLLMSFRHHPSEGLLLNCRILHILVLPRKDMIEVIWRHEILFDFNPRHSHKSNQDRSDLSLKQRGKDTNNQRWSSQLPTLVCFNNGRRHPHKSRLRNTQWHRHHHQTVAAAASWRRRLKSRSRSRFPSLTWQRSSTHLALKSTLIWKSRIPGIVPVNSRWSEMQHERLSQQSNVLRFWPLTLAAAAAATIPPAPPALTKTYIVHED